MLQKYIPQWMSTTKNSAAMVRDFRIWLSQDNLTRDVPASVDLKIIDQTTVAMLSITAPDPDRLQQLVERLAKKHDVTLIPPPPIEIDSRPKTFV